MDAPRAALVVDDLGPLIAALRSRGRVIGPTPRDGAIALDDITSAADLPRGLVDEQEAGQYRLSRAGTATFGLTLAPESYKRFLYPPRLALWTARGAPLRTEPNAEPVAPFTLLGLRACDLAAIRVLDRVLLGGTYQDADYRRRRDAVLLVAVACARAAPTCFCVSTETGPLPRDGYDILLTELDGRFLVEGGSASGDEIVHALSGHAPDAGDRAEAAAGTERAREQQRSLPAGVAPGLARQWGNARWSDVAARCLSCGNCTEVCPTCFCVTAERSVDLAGSTAVQSRRWDSCFTTDHSYLHGGAVHRSRSSRYRQWLTHKLSTWHDQFGSSGCVGCGRCITWCPAGIDITAEAHALVDSAGG